MSSGSGAAVPFALLRRARHDAGLTQEELAECARLSWRAISDLERGVSRPRADTVALLADALLLADEDRAAFEAAAQRPVAPRRAVGAPAVPDTRVSASSCACMARYTAYGRSRGPRAND